MFTINEEFLPISMDRINMSSNNAPTLPPGFRFHPTDQELIIFYLKKKASSSSNPDVSIIADVNIYQFNPWELPGKALFGESEWFFFSPRDRKYPNGARPNRAAASGYWKATGTDKPILSSNGLQCLGVKKALVFYKGRPPKGLKTNWMMLEYRIPHDHDHQLHKLRGSMRLDDWVLCRLRLKSNTPQPKEDNYFSSSCDNSSQFTQRCLRGQEMLTTNTTFKDYDDNNSKGFFMAPLENQESEDYEQGQVDFQEGSPGYSVSATGSNAMISPFHEALESIKKVFSIGAFEELAPVPPKKRLHVSTSNNPENGALFEVSSSAVSTPYLRSYSGFLI